MLGIIDQPILKERWLGIAGQQTTLNGTFPCNTPHGNFLIKVDFSIVDFLHKVQQSIWQRHKVPCISGCREACQGKAVRGHWLRLFVCHVAVHVHGCYRDIIRARARRGAPTPPRNELDFCNRQLLHHARPLTLARHTSERLKAWLNR